MSPTVNAGQDAAVAVLQAQQASLEASLRDLARTMSEGFASISARMDRINEIATTMAQVSERQQAHSEGLGRLTESLDSLDDKLQEQSLAHMRFVEAQQASHLEIDKKFSFARGVVIGISTVYAVALGLLVWAAGDYRDRIVANTDYIRQLQIENARHHPKKD